MAKKKIANRFRGELPKFIFEACVDFLMYRDFMTYITMREAFSRYIGLGKITEDKAITSLYYNYLIPKFGDDKGLKFGNIFFPMLNKRDVNTFIREFADLIAPYFLYKKRLCTWPGVEGTYEQFGVEVRSGDVVIDAGANMGLFSVFAASKGATVYAFEPIPEAIEVLKKTISVNAKYQGKIFIVPLALSDKEDTVKFEYDVNNLGGTSMILERGSRSYIQVKTISLDQWVARNEITKVDFIKADIEGAERFMLKGARNILRNFKPKISACTYHLDDDPQVLENIIIGSNPEYVVNHSKSKLFAL
jgi:FkbM family methyltransferase